MWGLIFTKVFQDILSKEYKNGTKVYREKDTDDRRIDLVIEGESYYYPIEVKIDARDQYQQIERYFRFDEKQRRGRKDFDTKVYYLTLDGREPSKESVGEVLPEQMGCISFQKQIRSWLNRCEEIVANIPNINIILRIIGVMISQSLTL